MWDLGQHPDLWAPHAGAAPAPRVLPRGQNHPGVTASGKARVFRPQPFCPGTRSPPAALHPEGTFLPPPRGPLRTRRGGLRMKPTPSPSRSLQRGVCTQRWPRGDAGAQQGACGAGVRGASGSARSRQLLGFSVSKRGAAAREVRGTEEPTRAR